MWIKEGFIIFASEFATLMLYQRLQSTIFISPTLL